MPAKGVWEGQVGGRVESHENGRLTMVGTPYLAGVVAYEATYAHGA